MQRWPLEHVPLTSWQGGFLRRQLVSGYDWAILLESSHTSSGFISTCNESRCFPHSIRAFLNPPVIFRRGEGSVNGGRYPRLKSFRAFSAFSLRLWGPPSTPYPPTRATEILRVSPGFTWANGPNEKKKRVSVGEEGDWHGLMGSEKHWPLIQQ